MKNAFAVICATLIVTMALPATAGVIGISDFSGSETIVNMSSAGVPPPGSFSYSGLTFSESSTGTGGPGWRNLTSLNYGFTDNAGISDITINLNGSYTRAGLNVHIGAATYLVSFFDMSFNLLGTDTVALSSTADVGFAGWEDANGIGSINILETSGENGQVGGFDLVRFENANNVPEPSSLALLALGLLGFSATRRRKEH